MSKITQEMSDNQLSQTALNFANTSKNQRARAHYIILITQLCKIFTSSTPRITLTNHFIQTTTKSIKNVNHITFFEK